MQRLSRSLSRLETQDIKTQPQFNIQNLLPSDFGEHVESVGSRSVVSEKKVDGLYAVRYERSFDKRFVWQRSDPRSDRRFQTNFESRTFRYQPLLVSFLLIAISDRSIKNQ